MGDSSIADVSAAQSAETRHIQLADETAFQFRILGAPEGLTIKALPNGCIYSIEHGEILINQVLASPLGGGIHRIYLRILDGGVLRFAEIVGPGAESEFTAMADRFVWRGSWNELEYRCQCWLPAGGDSWVFQVKVENAVKKGVKCDAILVQDIGLASRAQARNNERYTSQYLDYCAVPHAEWGYLLLTRQNLSQPQETHPWLMQGCFGRMAGFTTDGFDFFGVKFKESGVAEAALRETIGESVRQYEAGYTAIQSAKLELACGERGEWTFFARFVGDHPEASSSADIDDGAIRKLQQGCEAAGVGSSDSILPEPRKPVRSLFQTAPFFAAEDLSEGDIRTYFPGDFRHEEFAGSQRQSFFVGEDSRHVVLKAKEVALARPHGHIMRSGQGLMPDAEVMSCAFYAAGIFGSHMALGNTVLGKFISGVRDALNIMRSGGLRMFVREHPSAGWALLGVPSAFEMAPSFCRWYYKKDRDLLTVTCRASDEDAAFVYSVESGRAVEWLICAEISAGPQEYDFSPRVTIDGRRARLSIRPDQRSPLAQGQPEIAFHVVSSTPHAIAGMGGHEMVGPGIKSPALPYVAIRTHATTQFLLGFLGTFGDMFGAEALCTKHETLGVGQSQKREKPSAFWNEMAGGLRIHSKTSRKAAEIQDALVWMARDAVIHFSVPRGLEQANGGAWGVRDVCQGAVEFLISRDRADVVKSILLELFSHQYRGRGDWPQWFMFAPFQRIQSSTCHGDILIWPLKALCDYLEQTNDGEILRHDVAYTDDERLELDGCVESVLKHVDRLIERIQYNFLPGASLPCYGEGDWDDSLQPVSEDLAQRMVSSWTVALMYQTLVRYATALERFGEGERANAVGGLAGRIRADFQRFLVPDGVVAGFAVFGSEAGNVDYYMLHPRDARTGLRYRLISMTRGILSGIFSPEQAQRHMDLVKKHLVFPDGARLIDRPTTYRGGRETIFRRSESAAFFGREIGLQYVHAHLRYAEALACLGQGDEMLHALSVVNPIAVTRAVKNALPRQRNCYFTSSDAVFRDRYDASKNYEKLRDGQIPVDGGWRVYSSGAGIFTNLVVRHLLGIRNYFDCIDFDPVLPAELDGVCCDVGRNGRRVRYEFRGAAGGGSVRRVLINGAEFSSFSRPAGQYRDRGVRMRREDFEGALKLEENRVEIEMGTGQ